MRRNYRIKMRHDRHVILAAEPDMGFVISITGDVPAELLAALPALSDPNQPHKRVRVSMSFKELPDAPDGPAGVKTL